MANPWTQQDIDDYLAAEKRMNLFVLKGSHFERLERVKERMLEAAGADIPVGARVEFVLCRHLTPRIPAGIDKKANNFFFGEISYAFAKVLPSDDALAALVGHELGHLPQEKTHERVARKLTALTKKLSQVDLSTNALLQGDIARDFFEAKRLAKQYRAHELKADESCINYMVKAGYNPCAAITVLKRMKKIYAIPAPIPIPILRVEPSIAYIGQGRTERTILSGHPPIDDTIAFVNRYIRQLSLQPV